MIRPRSHPHPSSNTTVRDHTLRCAARSTLSGHTPTSCSPHRATSDSPASSATCSAGRETGRAAGRAEAVGLRGCWAWLGQAVRDQEVHRLAWRVAQLRGGVTQPAALAAPMAVPQARLDVHRAGSVTVLASVHLRIREAAHRHLALPPLRQLDTERP